MHEARRIRGVQTGKMPFQEKQRLLLILQNTLLQAGVSRGDEKVMKYSGPRMLLPHPIFAMSHVTAMIKHKKQSGEKDKEQAND